MVGFPILKSPFCLFLYPMEKLSQFQQLFHPKGVGREKTPGDEVASDYATTCTLHLVGYYIQFLQAVLFFYLMLEIESGKSLKHF